MPLTMRPTGLGHGLSYGGASYEPGGRREKAPLGDGAKLGPSCMGLPVRRQTHD